MKVYGVWRKNGVGNYFSLPNGEYGLQVGHKYSLDVVPTGIIVKRFKGGFKAAMIVEDAPKVEEAPKDKVEGGSIV